MSDVQHRKQCELVAKELSFFLVLCPHERPAMLDVQCRKPHEMVAKEQLFFILCPRSVQLCQTCSAASNMSWWRRSSHYFWFCALQERPAMSDAQRRKQRELVAKEIERLQTSIQSLTRSANPLGKIMDYVQEDMDSMQKELDRWQTENKEHALALRRERK